MVLGAASRHRDRGRAGGPVVEWLLILLASLFGVLFVLPIGGADMPVVISLLNAFTGLAASATGFVLRPVLIVAGMLVGSSGTLLTLLMAKAMNRSVYNVLFGAFGQVQAGQRGRAPTMGAPSYDDADDVAVRSRRAQGGRVPGYGMAVAQAQHDVRATGRAARGEGRRRPYAIHPVAGRMPGHMNVLLAEANVPYDQLKEMDGSTPSSRDRRGAGHRRERRGQPRRAHDTPSPIYGMPILEVDKAKRVVVMKRSMAPWLRRHRQRAVPRAADDDAVREREGLDRQADRGG